MKYWIYINEFLYIQKSRNIYQFLNDFLKQYRLNYDDMINVTFGYCINDTAFIMFNNAELNEVADWLSNFFKKVYILGW